MIDFECLMCGTCCKDLLENFDGVLRGLLLTEKEAKLFPKELISPKIAIGVKKPKKIIQYQLNVNVCPHLDENNCKIYDKRPLMCKEFPYDSGTYSLKCHVFSHLKTGAICDAKFSEEQYDASEKLTRYISNRYEKYVKKKSNLWEFDLATKKWKIKSFT